MKPINHPRYRIRTLLFPLLLLLVIAAVSRSCSGETADITPSGGERFKLSYTIPDTSSPVSAMHPQSEGRITRTGEDYVPSVGNENRVSGLHLLFFPHDDHGNGTYLTTLAATLKAASIDKVGEVDVTLTGGIVDGSDYDVLAVANLSQYFTADAIQTLLTSCVGLTYNRVKRELLPILLQTSVDNGILTGGDGILTGTNLYLLMSGTALKQANKDLTVDLLRASVRIDLRVDDAKTSVITLKEAQLRNVAATVPLFTDPTDVLAQGLTTPMQTIADNRAQGLFHATESYLDTRDSQKLLTSALCLILNAKSTAVDYRGETDKTWYRLNIGIGDDKRQYLRRNNAYTVVIKDITTRGSSSAEEAYYSDATLITGVTLPADWTAAEELPPVIEVN